MQGVLEERFSRLLGEPVRVIGAGRTDAGVHALGQVANFQTSRPIPLERLLGVLNASLPSDVKVQSCQEVEEGFHARRAARSRTYRYTVLERTGPSPLLGRYALVVPPGLEVERMERVARRLVGERDFRAFQGGGAETKSTVRRLVRLECRREGEAIAITAEANSFLYQMVRIVTATLLAVGRGEMTGGDVLRVLQAGERRMLPGPAPACGLCLLGVSY